MAVRCPNSEIARASTTGSTGIRAISYGSLASCRAQNSLGHETTSIDPVKPPTPSKDFNLRVDRVALAVPTTTRGGLHDERREHADRTAGSREPSGQAGVRDADHSPPGGGPALLLQVPRPRRHGREQREDPRSGNDRGRRDDAADGLALPRLRGPVRVHAQWMG